jgi:tetratricopeptide (TPR) repeat protein
MQVGRGYWVLGDFKTAEWWFERALEVQPDQGLATAELAKVALMRGDTQRARLRLTELLQSAERYPSYYDEALLVAMDLGDLELARQIMDDLPEELMDVRRIERSYLELETGNRQRGNSLLSATIAEMEAIAPTAEQWDPWYGLARAYAVRGDAEAAAGALEEASRRGWRLYHDARISVLFASVRQNPDVREILDRVRDDIERMRRRVEVARDAGG